MDLRPILFYFFCLIIPKSRFIRYNESRLIRYNDCSPGIKKHVETCINIKVDQYRKNNYLIKENLQRNPQ